MKAPTPASFITASLLFAPLHALAQDSSPSSDEVRATVAEILADTQARSSLLAGGTAGYDGKFVLAGNDGAFRLNVSGQVQFRYIIGVRDNSNTAGNRPDDDFTTGFQNRRTKLLFDGTIAKDWTYFIQGAFDSSGGNFGLEYGGIGYDFGGGWKARFGQFKLPFSREEAVSSRYQLAVERSVANAIFTQDYSQGVEISYSALDWRVLAAFSDGFGTKNTDYPNSAAQADYAFTGRLEYKVAGPDFEKTFKEFTSEQGGPWACLLGAAMHYQESPNSSAPADVDTHYLGYTADLSLKGDGWNAFAAGYGRHVDTRAPVGAPGSPGFDDFGAVVQGGFRILKDTELFARYDGVFLDSDRSTSGNDTFNFLTFGINEYFAGQAAKGTIDVVYSIDQTANLAGARALPQAGFPSTGLGLLGDSKAGEVAVRMQFQLLF
jgi:hypothetical protein